MSGHSNIEQLLVEFVSNNSHVNIDKVSKSTLLFQEGIFDSMGFVLLVDYIEDQFGIKAADDDLVEENFESIMAIENFIQRKLVSA